MKNKMKKRILVVVAPVFVVLLSAVLMFNSFYDSGSRAYQANAVSVSASTTKLSMVEMNNSFDKMVLRATENKTLVYVDKLYFDYSPLSSKRLNKSYNDETDYCVLEIGNETGEWAKVCGYVRHERGVRPNDPMQREMDLTYIEVGQYWEWRNFNNDENWTMKINDGYKTVNFSFDLNSGADGAVYYIDGVFALPERYYPQVVYWWNFNGDDPQLLEVRNQYMEMAQAQSPTTSEGEPFRFGEFEYKTEQSNNTQASSYQFDGNINNGNSLKTTSDNNGTGEVQAQPCLFGIIIAVVITAIVVGAAATAVIVTSEQKHAKQIAEYEQKLEHYENVINETFDKIEDLIAETGKQQEIIDEYKAEVERQKTEFEEKYGEGSWDTVKEELDKHKEFTIDNDLPAGQKVVKLKVKDDSGLLQSVYDENGSEVYVNRNTFVVGNATYALRNRANYMPIIWYSGQQKLQDTKGNKITVNVDNKIMNMDGIELLSPVSKDDVLTKLSAMGKYTSSIDASKLLTRIDDDRALMDLCGSKYVNPQVGFWETIGNAFNNLFSGNGTSKGFLSNFIDVLIVIGICLGGVFVASLIFGILRRYAFKE